MAGDVSKSGGGAGESDQSRPALPEAPLALYRRYRPATFAEVKGQEHVTEPLRQALRSGRVHHAYLFSGPRGCGKTSSARILARSLNCERGPTPDPCGECASCVALAPAGPGSIDVIEIDAASHGGIDDARDLRERAFYSPVSARYKIYIIDEAHMVTGAGFNALLKLVEEPPPHLKFVFATTEPEKVIPTIRSRTHHYPFRLVPPAILRELLEEILAAEGIGYEPAVLPVVIRAGAGSVRDSLSILDQLIAGADESGLRYDQAIALLGYTDDALLDEMAEAFAARDGAAVFVAIDHVVEAGHDPRRFAMDLLDRLRDLIILAAVPDAASSGLLEVPEDQLERMRKQADGFGQERLARAAETISAGLVEMRGATSPRLLLELMCAQVLLPAVSADGASSTVQDDLAVRLDRLERQLAAGGAAGSEPVRRRDAAPERAKDVRAEGSRRADTGTEKPGQPATAGGGNLTAAALRDRWPEVLETVRDIRRTAWILLSNFASVAEVEGNVLTMAFDSEGNAKGFASSGSDAYLADVIQSMFGVRPIIRAIVQPGAGRGGGRPGQGGRDDGTTSVASGDHGARGSRDDASSASTGTQADRDAPSGHRAQAHREGRRTAGNSGPEAKPAQGASGADGTARRDDQTGQAAASRTSSGPPARATAAAGRDRMAAQRKASALADDPRLQTDAEPPGSGDEITGSDLIMRELGGQVIGEISEV